MHPRKRKRYLLLASETEIPKESRAELTRLLLQRYPDLDQKKMAWVGKSLIFRTDQVRLPEMKLSLVLKLGDVTLTPTMASGSISKLKRAAELPTEREWSSSSRKSTSRKSSSVS
jgi:hypothetical protein